MTGGRVRVAFVVPDLGIGGAERHVVTLVSRLDRSRFEPMVVCLGQPGELFSGLAQHDVQAVALHRTKRESLLALRDLVRVLRRARPDVVITRGYNAEVLGRVAAVLAGVRRNVVWVHNCGDLAQRGVVRQVSDRVLGMVTDAYFGVAHAQLGYLTEELGFPERKIRIIHNGVEPTPFLAGAAASREELGIDGDGPVVGILAALRPEKDHATFLRAAASVARRCPDARFLVVGDGPERRSLEALAGELGVADRVSFAGARDDIPRVLGAMDVAVLCSFTIECFPMALLEAMAASLPAVCTAVGGVPELLADGVTGYLVPARDPDALAERLASLVESEPERRRLGEAGRARVLEHFTLQRSVAEAERQILEVVGQRRGARPDRPIRLSLILDETFVGGVELLMLEVFRRLDPEVVRPRLVCLRSAGPLAAEYRAAGFEVEVLERAGRFDTRTLPRLVRSLRSAAADAVLVTHHHRASLALGRLAARLAGVPVSLVAVHDMDLTSIGKRCLPRWAVSTLRWSDALVLLSPSQGEYLHREEGVGRHPGSRTREVVIRNGVQTRPLPGPDARGVARRRLGFADDDFLVGIVARLSAQKAHHVLLEAFAALRRRHGRARLVLIGGGDREAELRRLTVALGLQDVVHFAGIRRDVAELLPAFDAGCLSSVHEGVPLAAIEFMAAAVPMVVTDCGALRDIIVDGEDGFVVPVNDSAALADRLDTLASDPELAGRMGAAAHRHVERSFRIDQTARDYQDLLVELTRS